MSSLAEKGIARLKGVPRRNDGSRSWGNRHTNYFGRMVVSSILRLSYRYLIILPRIPLPFSHYILFPLYIV